MMSQRSDDDGAAEAQRVQRMVTLACRDLPLPNAGVFIIDGGAIELVTSVGAPPADFPARIAAKVIRTGARIDVVQGGTRGVTSIGEPLRDEQRAVAGAIVFWSPEAVDLDDAGRAALAAATLGVADIVTLARARRAAAPILAARDRSIALYHGIFNSHALGISIIDLDRTRVGVNPRYCEIMGYVEHELIGTDFRTLPVAVEPEHGDSDSDFTALVEGRMPIYLREFDIYTRAGRRITIRKAMILQRDFDGRPLHCLAFVEDISDFREAKRRTEQSEALFQIIFENAGTGLALVGVDSRFRSVNGELSRILGRDASELVGMSYRDVTHPEDVAANQAGRDALFSGKIDRFRMEKRFLRPDGNVVWADLTIARLPGAHGGGDATITVINDITARKSAELARELLVNELNHRVKNTLTIVSGIAGQTLALSETPAAFKEAFARRLQSLARAHDLITANNWAQIPLHQLVEQQVISPFNNYKARISIAGQAIMLSPQIAVTVGIVLFELATNAVKHGSLRDGCGAVDIRWCKARQNNRDGVELTWTESGLSEAVVKPKRSGFGMVMLERGIAFGLGGRCKTEFRPGGLACEMFVPLA